MEEQGAEVVDFQHMKSREMLEILDDLRERVEKGEITGFVLAADTSESHIITAIGKGTEKMSVMSLLGAIQVLLYRVIDRFVEL